MSSEASWDWDWEGNSHDEPRAFVEAEVEALAGEADHSPSAQRRTALSIVSPEAILGGPDGSSTTTGWTPPKWNPPKDPGPIWSPTVWPPPTGSLPAGDAITISVGSSKRRLKMLPGGRRHAEKRERHRD
jgi:hypothetical protein